MKNTFSGFLILCLALFYSCDHQSNKTAKVITNQGSAISRTAAELSLYRPGALRLEDSDTIIGELRIQFLIAPESVKQEGPRVNILIASMKNKDINDFTQINISELQKNARRFRAG